MTSKRKVWTGDSSDKEDTENHDEDCHEEPNKQTEDEENKDKMKVEKNAENRHKTTYDLELIDDNKNNRTIKYTN